MKSIVVLFDEKNKYEDIKAFDGKSAVELCAAAAASLELPVKTVTGLCTKSELAAKLDSICKENQADAVVFSFADCPFLNKPLVQELLDTHFEYRAEFTFAEGYPEGFAPVIIDKGTLSILAELSKTTAAEAGAQKITRNSLFELIKTDINSFEVETVLAPVDWRLFRFAFDCRKKETFTACQRLFELSKEASAGSAACAAELSELASKAPGILKTLPSFYNIQLAQKCRGTCSCCPYPDAIKKQNGKAPDAADGIMDKVKLFELIDKIADFSGEAVIGLSAWGECFNHPALIEIIQKILSFDGLSVLIEADGNSIPDDFADKLKDVVQVAQERTNGWAKIMLVVSMDGFSQETCSSIRGGNFDLKTAVESVQKLENAVPGCVYPQFVRMNANEHELEGFFRYWKEKTNASGGSFIIQKHNNFAGLLPNEEPADLSPLERNPCWHTRRDMTILCNGDVPLCYCRVLNDIKGNVFEEGIQAVWEKLAEDGKCGGCDEFYTFNF